MKAPKPTALQELNQRLPATVVFSSAEDGGFWVEAPSFPGCFASGDTLNEASRNFKLAIFDYFDVPQESQDEKFLIYQEPDLTDSKEVAENPREVSLIPATL
ncbi:MAG: hypothetical protein A3F35_00655 [Candidatus Woykebacteria bacterium RIFCSPHIGHO2_12_FULL_45_10]|uniref:HicB-like antitoxin of toxin-antitoxin system domain-containing protein n=1 Tax=Candidatus Woykebacteria bacterium RIFCSPHIGHO2_12_FULL_45_10 TaxID=1802603 RepID=A0A1G1WR05_9BACT|nr:MAG: hypothetical protein A3F35_00655 [Candidatus Woykebacteria bacterium RIFCSPHIGHO2_12_FULL_45_10]